MESEAQSLEGTATPEPAAVARPAAPPAIETPVAKPAPVKGLLTRRLFILGGFWSALGLALVGTLGSPLDFMWPRKVAGGKVAVPITKDRIPAPGADPVPITEGRFFLLNLEEGTTPNGEVTPGGLLALWRKCPHLGCTVPYRPEFEFLGRKGWFRCPCHGSTYTREGGVLVAGPAPRPLDRFPIEVQDDGSIVVTTGVAAAEKGSTENPTKATPYPA